MSAIGSIVVYDGAATPAPHTLIPVSVSREKGKTVAEWRENASGVPLIAQVKFTQTIEKLKSGIFKVEGRVEVPVMETVTNQNAAGYTASPKVAYVNTMVSIGFFHERSDLAGRRLVRQLSVNLQNNTAGSLAPQVNGPLVEAIDQLINPT